MQNKAGFTIVEMMVVMVVIAILTIIAVSAYMNQVRNGRRADGINTVFSISLAEEQYRTLNTSYGTLAQVWSNVATSAGGYYNIAISNVTGTTYTITVTATGDQANDANGSTNCATLTFAMNAGTVTKTPAVCWPQ